MWHYIRIFRIKPIISTRTDFIRHINVKVVVGMHSIV